MTKLKHFLIRHKVADQFQETYVYGRDADGALYAATHNVGFELVEPTVVLDKNGKPVTKMM
jgi:hypothetical protein